MIPRWAALFLGAVVSFPLAGQTFTTQVNLTQTAAWNPGGWQLPAPQIAAGFGWVWESESTDFRAEAVVIQDSNQVFVTPGRTGGRLTWPEVGWVFGGWKVPEGETLLALGLQRNFGVTPLLRFLERAGRADPEPEFLLEIGSGGDDWTWSLAWAPLNVPQVGLDATSFWFPAAKFPTAYSPSTSLKLVRRSFVTPHSPTLPPLEFDPLAGAWEARFCWFLPWVTAAGWGFVGQDRGLQYRTSIESQLEYGQGGSPFDVVLEPWQSRVRVVGVSLQGAWGDLGWTVEGRWSNGKTFDSGRQEMMTLVSALAFRSIASTVDTLESAAGATWRWPTWGLTLWAEGKGWLVSSGPDVPVPALGRAVAGGLQWEQGRGPWSVQVQGVWEATERSAAVYTALTYQAETGEKWTLAVPRFFGRTDTLFGPFSGITCLQLSLGWTS